MHNFFQHKSSSSFNSAKGLHNFQIKNMKKPVHPWENQPKMELAVNNMRPVSTTSRISVTLPTDPELESQVAGQHNSFGNSTHMRDTHIEMLTQ